MKKLSRDQMKKFNGGSGKTPTNFYNLHYCIQPLICTDYPSIQACSLTGCIKGRAC